MTKTKKRDVQESLDFIIEKMVTREDVQEIVQEETKSLETKIDTLDTKVDKLDTKLGKFIESEIDSRKKLEVRATHTEKYLGIKPPVGTVR